MSPESNACMSSTPCQSKIADKVFSLKTGQEYTMYTISIYAEAQFGSTSIQSETSVIYFFNAYIGFTGEF